MGVLINTIEDFEKLCCEDLNGIRIFAIDSCSRMALFDSNNELVRSQINIGTIDAEDRMYSNNRQVTMFLRETASRYFMVDCIESDLVITENIFKVSQAVWDKLDISISYYKDSIDLTRHFFLDENPNFKGNNIFISIGLKEGTLDHFSSFLISVNPIKLRMLLKDSPYREEIRAKCYGAFKVYKDAVKNMLEIAERDENTFSFTDSEKLLYEVSDK